MAAVPFPKSLLLVTRSQELKARVEREFRDGVELIHREAGPPSPAYLMEAAPGLVLLHEEGDGKGVESALLMRRGEGGSLPILLLDLPSEEEAAKVVDLDVDGLVPALFAPGHLKGKVEDLFFAHLLEKEDDFLYPWMRGFGRGGDEELDLEGVEVSALLYSIYLFRRSGTLKITGEGGGGEIHFRRGFLCGLATGDSPCFSEFLVERGRLDSSRIEELRLERAATGIEDRVLIPSKGLLSPLECMREEEEYLYYLLKEILSPEKGVARFSTGSPAPSPRISLSGYPFVTLLKIMKEVSPPLKILERVPMESRLYIRMRRLEFLLRSFDGVEALFRLIDKIREGVHLAEYLKEKGEAERLSSYHHTYFLRLTGAITLKRAKSEDEMEEEMIYEDAILEPLKEGEELTGPSPLTPSYINQKFLDIREMDPYKILEIEMGATQEEIDAAYIRLMKIFDMDAVTKKEKGLAMKVSQIREGLKIAYRNVSSTLTGMVELTDPSSSITEIEMTLSQVNAELTFESGKEFLERGEFRQAMGEFRRAVEADPDNEAYNFYLGKALTLSPDSGEEEIRKGIKYLKVAIALSPETGSYYFYMGIACMKLEMFIQALINFKMALSHDPSLEEAKEYIEEIEKRDRFIG